MYIKTEPIPAVTHSALTCTTSSQQALAQNLKRIYALLQNDSDTVMYAFIGNTSSTSAAAATGIRLNAFGGSYEMSEGLGNLHTGWIFAMSTTANKNLLITEGATL